MKINNLVGVTWLRILCTGNQLNVISVLSIQTGYYDYDISSHISLRSKVLSILHFFRLRSKLMLLKDQMLSGIAMQWTNYVSVWKTFLTMDSRKG